MRDYPPAEYTFIGDPSRLPDQFFDALASLLLSLERPDEGQSDAEDKTRDIERK